MTIFGKHLTMLLPESSTHAPGHTGIPRWAGTRRRHYLYSGLESPLIQKIWVRRKEIGAVTPRPRRSSRRQTGSGTAARLGRKRDSKSLRCSISRRFIVELVKSGGPNMVPKTKHEA